MTITGLGPPTAQLPSIGKIKSGSLAELEDALQYLILIYNPEIHGCNIIDRRSCPLRKGARPHSPCSPRRRLQPLRLHTEATLASIRADAFERTYAVRWLTALVSQAAFFEKDSAQIETLVQDAASLLAICAGPASAGTRSRTFVFTSSLFTELTSIKIHITDLPLNNQDYASVGAQTWGGACLLAEMITHAPQDFGLSSSNNHPLRILELGAGTGLVSLTVAQLLSVLDSPAQVVATDFHPAVLANLGKNIDDNLATPSSSVAVSSHFLDWSNPPEPPNAPFDKPFDVILGADVVYELDHALWLKTCIEKSLRKPPFEELSLTEISVTALDTYPRFHLVIPFRSTHTPEVENVEKVFPFAAPTRSRRTQSVYGTDDDCTLVIIAKEMIVCEDVSWSSDRHMDYIHYTISWQPRSHT